MFASAKPRTLPLPLLLALIAVSLWTGLRLALWLYAGWDKVTLGQALRAMGLGAWFDLATLGYLLAPLGLGAALWPESWRRGRFAKPVYWSFVSLATALLLFGVVAEYVFWDEFSTRFNFIAVDYLIYTNEVIGNIRESYPVGLIFSAIGIAAIALTWALSRWLRPAQGKRRRLVRLAWLALAVLGPLLGWRLADNDQMYVTGNAYSDEMAGNGLYTLVAAMRRNELDYDRFYRTLPQERADAVLARLGVERAPLSRVIAQPQDAHEPEEMGPFRRKPRNVVLISVESLSASYLGAYGSGEGLTPYLDRLAAQGLVFTRAFATGTRTVRGLEALSIATPPTPGQSIVRRPNNEHLATIGEMLEHQGYAPLFMYGGYGYFDNMNAFFRGNDYKVLDRTDFPPESVIMENIWGVADEVLYNNALAVLDETTRSGKPFFAQLMTTSNHRPYTYPDGRIDIPSPGGRRGAVKYTDHALGRFIEDARAKPWFKDTLFVIVADHCASVAGKTSLPIMHYRIPIIFYAPDMLPAGQYTRMVSQIDIVPTLLDLLGAKGDEHYFGQSMFEATHLPERAFVSNYQELGYYRDGILTVLLPKQRVEAYRVDPKSYESTPTAIDPARLEEAIAYYQTASRAFKQGNLLMEAYRRKPVGR
jgi:phosphoglycerol transferase MdoB-like AlkP superfamily enzyme